MSEIIVIQVGRCGNAIGEKFWTALCKEHQISFSGDFIGSSQENIEGTKVFFKQIEGGKFVPRSILVDLDENGLKNIQSGPLSKLFDKNSSFSGNGGTQGNYAKALYQYGPELISDIMGAIYRETEICNDLQGFLLIHNTGGGTGSGLTSLIFQELRARYPADVFIGTFSIFSALASATTPTEAYNSALSIADIAEYADLAFCFDNDTLLSLCFHRLGITQPSLEEMNQFIVDSVSNITAPLRLPSKKGGDLMKLRDMAHCLVPKRPEYMEDPLERDVIFLTIATAPIDSGDKNYTQAITDKGIDWNKLFTRGLLIDRSIRSVSTTNSLYAIGVLRGNVPIQDVNKEIIESEEKHFFLPPASSKIKIFECENTPEGSKSSISFILNSPSIANVLDRICSEFDPMRRRKAFLHWFEQAGMDEEEVDQARWKVEHIASTYSHYADSIFADKEYYPDEEYCDEET